MGADFGNPFFMEKRMRKLLLATSALVAFAGAAQAAESPIQVTLGGSVDFRAAMFQESEKLMAGVNTGRRGSDFNTGYELTVAAEGKAANGITYGASVNLDNDQARAADGQSVVMDNAYVWVAGTFGKVQMGDEHGASLLFVYAPTVGENQIDGYYTNFVDSTTLARFQPTYVSMTEDTTKVTYFTPKVGNANHKVQLGVSYVPNAEQGTTVSLYDDVKGYKNQTEVAAQYTGKFDALSVTVSPMMTTGQGEGDKNTVASRDYTTWGLGAQVAYAGFTVGGSYVDAGHMNTTTAQTDDQDVWTAGVRYGFDKVTVAANYMNGQGYYNTLVGADAYVEDFDAIGLGATYTWFPGLATAADAVFFDQDRAGTTSSNKGHVLMLSQKMSF
ncbi:MAG TPA: hypothetical protein DCY07_06060 [Rhodospirillaceae bacterium]|nr:hypothetical protein [Rhodospirillaceae bacterium]